jgi:hypothetical protein
MLDLKTMTESELALVQERLDSLPEIININPRAAIKSLELLQADIERHRADLAAQRMAQDSVRVECILHRLEEEAA